MDLGFLSNFTELEAKYEFSNSKKDILKLLDILGVDTRFLSYFNENLAIIGNSTNRNNSNNIKLYINNLRFSKFSKRRIATFNKYFPDVEVIRSTLFQKICNRASKTLANYLNPKDTILLPKNDSCINKLLNIVLEPYSRKYGINILYYDEYIKNPENYNLNVLISPLTLNKDVNFIFSDIFGGIGIDFNKKFTEINKYFSLEENAELNNTFANLIKNKNIVFPFINVPEEWINDFLGISYDYKIDYNDDNIANSFMSFLENINPQYKENVLKATDFLELYNK